MNEAVKNAQADAVFVVFDLDTRTVEEAGLRVMEFLVEAQDASGPDTAFTWWFPQPELAILDGSDNYPFDIEDTWAIDRPDTPETLGGTKVLVAMEIEHGAKPDPVKQTMELLRSPHNQDQWPQEISDRLGQHTIEPVAPAGEPGRFHMVDAAPVVQVQINSRRLVVAGKDVVDVGAAVAVMGDSSAAQTALEVGGPQARPLISC